MDKKGNITTAVPCANELCWELIFYPPGSTIPDTPQHCSDICYYEDCPEDQPLEPPEQISDDQGDL